ncbi:MAG: sulfurtransferase TusA family protein, partial [Rhodospirillaceae bacterium]|nr:sulfurtransferase TusA family protein [Rhodospirillaceae bacterium]
MNKNPNTLNPDVPETIDCSLDITADTCPITYVKTKLKLETMAEGEILEIRLIGAEPLDNVPRTATTAGHTVLDIRPEVEGGGKNDVHRLLVRRGAT